MPKSAGLPPTQPGPWHKQLETKFPVICASSDASVARHRGREDAVLDVVFSNFLEVADQFKKVFIWEASQKLRMIGYDPFLNLCAKAVFGCSLHPKVNNFHVDWRNDSFG